MDIAYIALRAIYRVQGISPMKQAALRAVKYYVRKEKYSLARSYLNAGKKLLKYGDEKGPGNGRLR
jgi:hypothetical protein